MFRHALAPLFEPASLVVISDRDLPVSQWLPKGLAAATTHVRADAGLPPKMPGECVGVPLGSRPDLAVVCVAPAVLIETLRRLGPCAPRGLILLPHEQADPYPKGAAALVREWAQAHDCQVLGPRAFGAQRPHAGFNFSQHPSLARIGRVALVAQSRAIMAAVMDWAEDVHIGFSLAVALGDEAVVGLTQVLDFLASDPRTDSIALYIEDPGPAREFMSALRAAASVKPVVILKAGRDEAEGADAVLDAALRRAGAVRVRYFVQLFSAVKVLGYNRRPRGRRVVLLGNGSGPPQLALDLLGPDAAVQRAELSITTQRALAALLEPDARLDNPVITYVPLTAGKIQAMLDVLQDDAGVDGVLVLLAPDALADMPSVARQLAQYAPAAKKPVVTCFMGDAGMRPLRRMLDDAGTPAFRTPESAADAFGVLATHFYNQQLLLQALPPVSAGAAPDLDAARGVIALAREEGRQALAPAESDAVLMAFGLHRSRAVVGEADALGGARALPVRAMSLRADRDARFGPYLRFGSGGLGTPLPLSDRAADLAPLNRFLAQQMIERSRLWRRVFRPHMGTSATDALINWVVRLSEIVSELPDVACVAVDPIRAGDDVLHVERVVIGLTDKAVGVDPQAGGYAHMAIHPYPRRWVHPLRFDDGTRWTIRPIRPEDGDPLQHFIRDLSERSRYMRFVSMMRELTPRMLARYTQVDYHRELALVATTFVPNPAHRGYPQEVIIGLAHYLRHPDGRGAEYALVIGDAWQRRGLGGQLMRMLIDAAREQGLDYIDGVVLAENRPMLALMTSLGFRVDRDHDDTSLRRVWLDLSPRAGGTVES